MKYASPFNIAHLYCSAVLYGSVDSNTLRHTIAEKSGRPISLSHSSCYRHMVNKKLYTLLFNVNSIQVTDKKRETSKTFLEVIEV